MGPHDYYHNNYYGQQNQAQQSAQSYATYDSQTSTANQYGNNYQQNTYQPRQSTYQSQANDQGWNGTYESRQENSHGRAVGAAEALTNLSNNTYTDGTDNATSNSGAAPPITATQRYAGNVQHLPPANTGYGPGRAETQTPPVNYTNRQPSRSTATPAQPPTRQGLPLPVSVAFPSQTAYATANARASSPAQYARSSNQQTVSRNSLHGSGSTEYNNRSATNTNGPTNSNSVSGYQYDGQLPVQNHQTNNNQNAFEQPSMHTVDPIQVYDPWPEIQRKQEAARAAKAAEDAARVEEAARKAAEEQKRTDEENARKAEADRLQAIEEKRLAEELEKISKEEEKKRKRAENKKKKAESKGKGAAENTPTPAPDAESPAAGNEELEIRALMAKMRALNSKNPALLAKIWEEERKTNASSQSPKLQNKPTPRPKAAQPTAASASGNAISPPQASQNGVAQTLEGSQVKSPTAQTLPTPHTRTASVSKPTEGAVWPPEKRESLAAAAAKWLNANAANRGKEITAKEICDKLDKNPTYIELCEWFESKGLKLDRAQFARHLLEAVPDVNSASRQHSAKQGRPKGTTQEGTSKNAHADVISPASATATAAMPTMADAVPGSSNGASNIQSTWSTINGANDTMSTEAPSTSQYPPPTSTCENSTPYYSPYQDTFSPAWSAPVANIKSETESPSVAPPAAPKSKEEAARKRNFSDLIDLTQISDDELPQPVKKLNTGIPAPFVEQLTPHNFQAPSQFASTTYPTPQAYTPQPNPHTNLPQAHQPYVHGYGNSMASSTQAHTTHMQRPPAPPFQTKPMQRPNVTNHSQPPTNVPAQEDKSQMDVAQPIDRKNAVRRSTYNPKTIARDVLLACGRHPDMRALNAHLDILKTTFRFVDHASDLSTLRWDKIDPGKPIPEMLSSAQEGGDFADDEDEDDEDDRPPPGPSHAVQQSATVRGGSTAVQTAAAMPMTPNPKPAMPKRRGRPPKSKFIPTGDYPLTSRPYGFGDGEQGQGQAPQSAPGRERGPDGDGYRGGYAPSNNGQTLSSRPAPSSAPGPVTGYAAFRQVASSPDGTPLPKKKGRPVGWRKAIHGSAAAQANTARNPQPSGLRNVLTPAKPVVVVSSRSPSVNPQKRPAPEEDREYSVYNCRWKHCKAELHNLETLRKHCFHCHNKPTGHGHYNCLWTGCGHDVRVRDSETGMEGTKRKYFDFAIEGQWRQHMESSHFATYAWKHGDGPASGLSDATDSEQSEAYLSDSHGRRVTPRVTAPTDLSPPRPIPIDQPRRPGRPPKKPVEEEAKEAQRNVENRKRSFGLGVDRGGSRLVTEKRRMGFVDDEDVEEVVDMEET